SRGAGLAGVALDGPEPSVCPGIKLVFAHAELLANPRDEALACPHRAAELMVDRRLAVLALRGELFREVRKVEGAAQAAQALVRGLLYAVPGAPVVERQIPRLSLDGDFTGVRAVGQEVELPEQEAEWPLLVAAWDHAQAAVLALHLVQVQAHVEHALGHA